MQRDSPAVARDQQAKFGFLGLVNHTQAATGKVSTMRWYEICLADHGIA